MKYKKMFSKLVFMAVVVFALAAITFGAFQIFETKADAVAFGCAWKCNEEGADCSSPNYLLTCTCGIGPAFFCSPFTPNQ